MEKKSYPERLAEPKWQRKRLEILNRDNWTCQHCGDKTTQLEIHHLEYFEGHQAWEYDDDSLITICHKCHGEENIRFKHEAYFLKSLKFAGFLAVDVLAFSCLLNRDRKFSEFIKRKVREFSRD